MRLKSSNDFLVSICVITYNHELFIVETLESILNQKTDFLFEIIISNDASTDGTDKKISNLLKNHNKKSVVKYFNLQRNLGMMANFLFAIKQSGGKYIALCEGDDYWTDPYKLQKQVDFLEANNDYAICFTGYTIKNEFENQETIRNSSNDSFTIEEVIKENSFSTATAMFVSKYFNPEINWFPKMPFGDWTLYLVILFESKKKAYCLKDVTSVYRIHEGGVHGNLHASNLKLIEAFKLHILFYKKIKEYLFKGEYSVLIAEGIENRKGVIANLLKKENKHLAAIFYKWF